MQSADLYSELAFLQLQIQSTSEKFDDAFAHDANLGELKKLYHEIKILKEKLLEIQELSEAH